ncbi:uncharacterized protein LOC133528314 [Cydia pomonella]|uniref:uncharacterized protein LOC133528314 n=1 Tax=Cydia pomonella TaxID=82600 RepID=UPI002ADDD1C5|nr:uncharacterized protein LOC133528314 [Cydia pomonella]
MDLDDAITITPLEIDGRRWYVMIGWLENSFKLNLYHSDVVWKGKFSYNRLATFSRNFNMTENDYYTSIKRCLSEKRKDYHYELKDGFFYWKQKIPNGVTQSKRDMTIIRGFMPVELDTSSSNARPDLIEVLLTLNKQLKYKLNKLKTEYETIKSDYKTCLKDTQEFFNLKIEMEKALCGRFLNTIRAKKSELGSFNTSNTVCADTKLFINRLSKIYPDKIKE